MDREILRELTEFWQNGIVRIRSALTDGWVWVSQVFFLPGEFILAWLIVEMPILGGLLGPNSPDNSTIPAAVLSSVSWLFAAILVKAIYDVVRDLMVSVASIYRRLTAAAAYQVRMIRRLVLGPLRKIKLRMQSRHLSLPEEFQIDELQLAVLRAQSLRPPGHAITAIEAAEELDVRPLLAQQALSILSKLHLMEVSFATSDGCPGYFLTWPGEVYVASCDRDGVPQYPVAGPRLLDSSCSWTRLPGRAIRARY